MIFAFRESLVVFQLTMSLIPVASHPPLAATPEPHAERRPQRRTLRPADGIRYPHPM